MIDLEKKYLMVYYTSAKEDGVHFFAMSLFRHKYEFGLERYWDGDKYGPYRLYLEHPRPREKYWVKYLALPWTANG